MRHWVSPAWFAVLIVTALIAVYFLSGGPGTGIDGRRLLEAGDALRLGLPPYADPKYLYSPLAALLTVPLATLPRELVLDVWIVIEAAMVALAVWILASPLTHRQRAVAVVGVMLTLPVLWDLWLANVTIAVVGALAVALRGPDTLRRGILLGIALALVPKPMLLPALIWLAFFRRSTLVGAILVAGAATLAGLALLGPGVYANWITALLRGASAYTQAWGGNWGLSSLGAAIWAPIAMVDMVVLVALCALGRRENALIVALMGSLIVSPYVVLYTVLVAMLALPMLAERWPRATMALALVSPFAFGIIPSASAIVVTCAVAVDALGMRTIRQTPASG